MKRSFAFLLILSTAFWLFITTDAAEKKDKPQKVPKQKARQLPPQDDIADHIRCDEETYKKYSELRPRYLEIQRKIGEIDARLKVNHNNIERLKEMSDMEIDQDVRDENIRIMEEENSRLKIERKRFEEEGIEFYKTYEPIRHSCED